MHGVITAEEARRRAALIISRIKAGEEPLAEPIMVRPVGGPTVEALARRYLEDHVALRCKPPTESVYRLIVDKYIVPRLGKRPALAVGLAEVTELHHSLSVKPTMANQVVDTLSRIYNVAEDRGRIPEGSNPCRKVVKFRERKRERFPTKEELRRLGRELDQAETCAGVSVHALAAIRLLLLTGCRKGEILNLRWGEVALDEGEMRLLDTKTGPRTITLTPEAVRVLRQIPRVAGNPFVIPGRIKGRRMRNLNDPWEIICERAELKGVRIHDCRHSYASRALALGECLPMISRILGHAHLETTARYAHLEQSMVREAAARNADSIAGDVL